MASRKEPQGPRIGGGAELLALDASRAEVLLRDLQAKALDAEAVRLAEFLQTAHPDRTRLGAVLDLSSYLRDLALAHPDWLERLFETGAGDRVCEVISSLGALPIEGESETALMARLRLAKAEVSLLLALRDLFGAAHPAETTRLLSDLAEASVRAGLRFGLRELQARGKLHLPDPANPETGCGLFVLGMGKLGGFELNYSSDIDLIVFFDPDCPALVDPDEGVETFSRLIKKIVRIIGERTGEGYVFRTDLRLRPDPGAMPLAIPVPAAITYYESSGRNWERAAMIKARCIAGDEQAAAAFIDEMTPFVWRKYLDFASIAEIQSMKERIDRHRGFEGIAVAGHNVKLGPGGIREVEFFAQTQQLIAGGRNPALRLRRTDETLEALASGGWISGDTARDLTEAYWFLRRVEHAIQMVADEQSHTLPEDEAGLLRIARLLGLPDLGAFSQELSRRLEFVERSFAGLFAGRGEEADDEARLGRLLLSGEDDAAETALADLGFSRPADVLRILRVWGAGRYRATRAEATRTHLVRVLPALLGALVRGRDPDGAVASFDTFLARLPSGLQFFALIASNPRILDLLALIITAAPRLSDTLARRPHVFDALLDPAFFAEGVDEELLARRLDAFLDDASNYEDRLVRLRIFASEQQFLVGARLLSGAIEGEAAGAAYTAIADVVIAAALAAVVSEFESRHGRVPEGRLVLFGMGRLGSYELTAGSDVDLLLLYDHAEEAEASDGERPLAPALYYSRLTQRLIAALTAPMGEGVLYEVDFRLRPSGNKGPLATHIEAFRKYQRGEARTWERMALTRARQIAGDPALGEAARDAMRAAIAARQDEPETIAADVSAMRARIAEEKPGRGPLDVKFRAGGLVDLEFIAQWAVLAGLVPPDLMGRPTAEVLDAFEASSAAPRDPSASVLHAAVQAYTRVLQAMRLGPANVHGSAELPMGLAMRIAASLGEEPGSDVEAAVDAIGARVAPIFEHLLPLRSA
ncbi:MULTISPECIES: bifunctional [glutamine synthetase] adenylyltransferase/[glutamine synthetase]-adenylyl-L-tyrosine phosphorylase [unclassified Aureimonas]|uniref:bifunctional [glutamine synthetase] adenylyltransferase/[glutamine synthetase]-adenylyl-L-tyrosine phosphorylase n=1 Tax=unclassified Aureimonas TaxID=2615206 RepID=UPI00070E9F9C|nr:MULTISPECIES: bifunctional [glutamine synthetase] adenylyltransferase/[glutamine synthetase]-adenylyl-L-tyrosine phosphorylase [unclassified Aureimonas]KQT55284.1 bifunctional glutamine-synthetase adenylyltransferase/deadenyltransferase [Aureimonas sp. Leaf427]KQT71076.1 bifunctional glutamine-synthetase adenylyltransferase/deadenyltransferase [Aureimonas sp. Leaf460]